MARMKEVVERMNGVTLSDGRYRSAIVFALTVAARWPLGQGRQ